MAINPTHNVIPNRIFRFNAEDSQKIGFQGIQSLPCHIWEKIMSYTPRRPNLPVGSLTSLCRNGLIWDKAEKAYFSKEPYFSSWLQSPATQDQPIVEKILTYSNLIPNDTINRARQLKHYIQCADHVRKVMYGTRYNGYGHCFLDFTRDGDTLAHLTAQDIIKTSPMNDSFCWWRSRYDRTLETLRPLYSLIKYLDTEIKKPDLIGADSSWMEALFLTALLRHDRSLSDTFNLATLNAFTIDYAASLLLREGKVNQFHTLLPYTSIYSTTPLRQISGNHATERNVEVLTEYLCLAGRNNDLQTLRILLTLEKPYDAHEVLIELAQEDRPQALNTFFSENTSPINMDYIESNGRNERTARTPGIHTALLNAATRNLPNVVNTIFQNYPGQQIQEQIFTHTIDLFNNHASLHERGRDLDHREWQLRETHPNRSQVVQQFEAELFERYPNSRPIVAPLQEREEPVNIQLLDTIQVDEDMQSPPIFHAAIAVALFAMIVWNLPSSLVNEN